MPRRNWAPIVSSSMRVGAPVAVAAITSRSASAMACRFSERRTTFTDLNILAVAWRTVTKSGSSGSIVLSAASTRRATSRSAGSMLGVGAVDGTVSVEGTVVIRQFYGGAL